METTSNKYFFAVPDYDFKSDEFKQALAFFKEQEDNERREHLYKEAAIVIANKKKEN